MLGRRGLGQSDGRRTMKPQLLANLGQMPFTPGQKAVLDARARAVASAPPFVHPDLNFFNPPADSESFTTTPTPFVAYPVPGAGPVIVISKTIERGKIAVIFNMSVVHIGGNPPDGTGQVIWRVVKNGAGLRGLANLTSQFGTYANPKKVSILATENDTVQITVELPSFLPDGVTVNAAMPVGTRTAASFDGYTYPLSEATMPQQGNY